MAWWQQHVVDRWSWLALNGVALGVFVYVLTQGDATLSADVVEVDAMLATGKWGVRWLLVSLAMTPLHLFLRWRGALKLRKSAGLWAFAFGLAHLTIYARETWEPVPVYRTGPTPLPWLEWPPQPYIALGLVSLLILTALAVTSHRWAMRALGKGWKRLHRLVYAAGVAVLTHSLLASTMSKRMFVRDPDAVTELCTYLGILTVLLLVRVPQVRVRLLTLTANTPGRTVARVASPRVPQQIPPPQLPVPPYPSRDIPPRQVPSLPPLPIRPMPERTHIGKEAAHVDEREPVV